MNPSNSPKKIRVISNRLPIRMSKGEGGDWEVSPSPGGLVTALNPILKKQRGKWIGWIGCESDDSVQPKLDSLAGEFPYDLTSVPLTEDEENHYYRGFSNESIWPLYHDLLGYCKFNRDDWDIYKDINRRFAEYSAHDLEPDEIVWVHDYQLMLTGEFLREQNIGNPLLFFLHIPFPSPDLFRRLPWRQEIIEALIQFDLLGFQTLRDRQNFVDCVCDLLPEVGIRNYHHHSSLFIGNRRVRAGNWPISIDFDEFYNTARSKEVADAAWVYHEHFGDRQIVVGIDRLDYTKGIPERFLAFERFLEKYPEMRSRVCFQQIMVPSRTHVPDYQDLKHLIESEVGRINGRFSEAEWVPIHDVYRSLDRNDLLARYRASEVALVTPLRDGMNLVAKEYCASCVDNRGVLILSEFAGAFEELGQHSISVNPFDTEKTADAIYQALTMPEEERVRRIQALRESVKKNDVHAWVGSILSTVGID